MLIIFTVLTDLLSSVVETFNMISINVFHPAYILPILYILYKNIFQNFLSINLPSRIFGINFRGNNTYKV